MKNLLPVLALMFLALLPVRSGAEGKENFSKLIWSPVPPIGHFNFERDPEFEMIELELKNLIIISDLFTKQNHFCAVGYKFPEDERVLSQKEVIVYWKEENEVITWTGGRPELAKENFYYADTLIFARGFSTINQVKREDEGKVMLGTGGYFQDNVDNLLADCAKHGKQYVIEPFTPPPREF
jgi:hypothetical protein